jgi:hypothetical protein
VRDSFCYFKLKYISIHEVIATIKAKFSQLPTPKYLKTRKRVKAIEERRPRLELAKIKEKVKSRATKKVMKNRGTIPKVPGSTK